MEHCRLCTQLASSKRGSTNPGMTKYITGRTGLTGAIVDITGR